MTKKATRQGEIIFYKEKKERQHMKKISALAAAAMAAFMLTSCADNGYTVSYGESQLYTQEDIERAIFTVDDYIQNNKTFKRCDIHCIEFAGDNECQEESREGRIRDGVEYSQILVLTSDFKTPKFDLFGDMGGFNSDQEYTDWRWILGRTDNGIWEIVGQGVC